MIRVGAEVVKSGRSATILSLHRDMKNTTHPEAVVGTFIVNGTSILLTRSPKWESGTLWVVPGGHIEYQESIEEAVVREVQEEVGILVKFEKVFAVYDAIEPKHFFKKRHFIFLECVCRYVKNELKIDNTEIIEAQWVEKEKIFQMPLEPFTRKAIESMISQGIF